MNTALRRIAAAAIAAGPLAASAGVVVRNAEGPSEASAVWQLLGTIGPALLWGLPLAYVIFSLVALLPRHPKGQSELEPPREGTLLEGTSMFADSDGW